jgi:hypothetical protein
MNFEDEIVKAIETHWKWKMRLRSAIDSGQTDANVAEVANDNVCEFGQWLYGPTIPDTVRDSVDYASVCKLHADFHKCAANVLKCVSNGQKTQANALMTGAYS